MEKSVEQNDTQWLYFHNVVPLLLINAVFDSVLKSTTTSEAKPESQLLTAVISAASDCGYYEFIVNVGATEISEFWHHRIVKHF